MYARAASADVLAALASRCSVQGKVLAMRYDYPSASIDNLSALNRVCSGRSFKFPIQAMPSGLAMLSMPLKFESLMLTAAVTTSTVTSSVSPRLACI